MHHNHCYHYQSWYWSAVSIPNNLFDFWGKLTDWNSKRIFPITWPGTTVSSFCSTQSLMAKGPVRTWNSGNTAAKPFVIICQKLPSTKVVRRGVQKLLSKHNFRKNKIYLSEGFDRFFLNRDYQTLSFQKLCILMHVWVFYYFMFFFVLLFKCPIGEGEYHRSVKLFSTQSLMAKGPVRTWKSANTAAKPL